MNQVTQEKLTTGNSQIRSEINKTETEQYKEPMEWIILWENQQHKSLPKLRDWERMSNLRKSE